LLKIYLNQYKHLQRYIEITHICGILDVNCGKQSQICRKFAVSGKHW